MEPHKMENMPQKRTIVKIDPDKCDGCGQCIPSCAEGAIKIINGKAVLSAEKLCDGLGNCLGHCPKDAITIETREADAFDPRAVEEAKIKQQQAGQARCKSPATAGHCPGAALRSFNKPAQIATAPSGGPGLSALNQWPIQLHLLPAESNIWKDADILIAADCTAFALANFHDELLAGKTLAIACPKLDNTGPYVEKLAEIFRSHKIRSLTIARMEVPCCGGLTAIVQQALESAGRNDIPTKVVIIATDGNSFTTQTLN